MAQVTIPKLHCSNYNGLYFTDLTIFGLMYFHCVPWWQECEDWAQPHESSCLGQQNGDNGTLGVIVLFKLP